MTTAQLRPSEPVASAGRLLSKVPEVTALFWITKVLTTGMGEDASDFLVRTLNPIPAVGLGGLLLAAALTVQFRAKRYVPWVYWLAVTMVSVFGTMAADVLHVGFGVPYVVSAPGFLVALLVIFAWWRVSEGTLSIHSVHTPKREFFYWAAVLATFALGTAVGDMTASTVGLGYFSSGVVFTVAIALPALAHRFFKLDAVLAFWLAYILTRPLGASYADWMGAERSHHGLGWGFGPVSLVLTVLIAALVAVLTVQGSRGGQRRHRG
ncbi:COG4705 family protein [Kitasatospora sp. LaBMicrA B282]|uniref:COG4705 family protein n=1 Tax=Kitasatospora sp. LaBMicrA B282 TaxID=3420949 RepID=UPI003D0BD3B8